MRLALACLLVASACNPDPPLDADLGGGSDEASPQGLADAGADMASCPGSSDLANQPLLPMALAAPTVIADNAVLLAAADLDADGHLNLVESASGALQLRYGRGATGFDPPLVVWRTTMDNPVAAVVADVNGDGRLDVLADAGGIRRRTPRVGALAVVLGRGDRTPPAAVEIELDREPGAMLAADFDGDGRTDVAVLYPFPGVADSAVDVLGFDDDGTPFVASSTSLGRYPVGAPSVGDWNGDGVVDLAVGAAGYSDGQRIVDGGVLLLFGLGDGTLAAPLRIATVPDLWGLATGDWDGDGDADLAVSGQGSDRGAIVAVHLGSGDGTFAPPLMISSIGGAGELASADFNGDGVADLALENDDGVDVEILLGRGDGAFEPARRFVTGDLAAAQFWRTVIAPPVLVADLDEDGRLDVALSGYAGPVILAGDGEGGLRSGTSHDAGGAPSGLALADFDADGHLDFASADGAGAVDLSFGSERPDRRKQVAVPGGNSPQALVLGDFDGDGLPDLVVGEHGIYDGAKGTWREPGLSFLRGRGDGSFAPPLHTSTLTVAFALAAGDFNGDGITDVAAANVDDGSASLLLGRGDGTFGDGTEAAVGGRPVALAVGDLDGDLAPDLVVGRLGGGSGLGGLARVRVDRRGRLHESTELLATATGVRSVLIGDVDGDGHADVIASTTEPSVVVLLGRCDGTFDELPPVVLVTRNRAYATSAALANLDGNGFRDLLLTVPGTDWPFVECFERCPSPGILVLPGVGHGRFAAPIALGAGYLPSAVAATDLDGDHRPDVVVLNAGGGTFSIFRNVPVK